MATFTKIADGEQPVISLNSTHKVSKIEDNTYGGFTEHMGRCIYGGIYDPGNPLSDEDGFRKDVIEAMKELNSPVVRYPGGNFCATYHWQDGVGPREKRPKKAELAWLGVESNQFGTDEFMRWCEKVGTKPYIALNMGTGDIFASGTLDEAMGWVEYCNSTKDSHYANMRRANGRENPYNVKYWALGNECYGAWQVEQMTKEDYAKKAYQWAKTLKLLDPSIELILCGQDGVSSWDHYVLKKCINYNQHALGDNGCLIGMHSIHFYTTSEDHLMNVTAPRAAERAIQMTGAMIDLAHIENKIPVGVRKQKICFDEWNVWTERAYGPNGAEEKYTLSDALAVAVWLNVFIRQSKYIGMANIAQSVNVISPLMTTKDGTIKQTTWWPWLLFCKYMRGSTLSVHVQSGEYEGPTKPAWIRGSIDTPWLDVSAAISDDGVVSLVVVNIGEEKAFKTKLEGVKEGVEVDVYLVGGENVQSTNMNGKEDSVMIKESKWDGKGLYEFPKTSMTMLRWKA
ncbi:glycoside hydrolase family 51 protein [Cadophora sp. DSE1049]|nr:glycoside hydrolase family 51 protein [Cadophora sp. DSE1049]